MGKYKSYIFLGITVLILLLVGYCVAKNSKGKKEEKEFDKKEVPAVKGDNKIPKAPPSEIVDEPKPVQEKNQGKNQGGQQPKITETPISRPEKKKVYSVNLNVLENNKITWDSDLANSGATLTIVIERRGEILVSESVSGLDSFTWQDPGKDSDKRDHVVTLKIVGVEYNGKNSVTGKFTCTVH
jgi:hypothetical protein